MFFWKFFLVISCIIWASVCSAQNENSSNDVNPQATALKNKVFPPFEKYTVDGIKIDSNYLKGKVVVLNYWFIGCLPCMAEISTLNKLYEHFKDSDVVILSVAAQTKQNVLAFNADTSQGNSENLLRKYMKLQAIEYPIIAACDSPTRHYNENEMGSDCDLNNPVEITAFPITFILDKNRMVRNIHMGGEVSFATASQTTHIKGKPVIMKAGTAVTPGDNQYDQFYKEIETLLK